MELARAKELLTALADGIDPFTGEVFQEIMSVTSRIRFVRFTASYRRCLRNGRRTRRPMLVSPGAKRKR